MFKKILAPGRLFCASEYEVSCTTTHPIMLRGNSNFAAPYKVFDQIIALFHSNHEIVVLKGNNLTQRPWENSPPDVDNDSFSKPSKPWMNPIKD